ncbi:TetR/AcrR family transcriptional regulator [Paenibacillus sanguinis]|uniref:TetR/AcrR family transcriptional regulator n=1 Tax=Paenibacillus sanguinis TaxID=225906 RepID=UPI00039A8D31|nr:TetR family transcriptional regulator [Paenibacillus sanguinis]
MRDLKNIEERIIDRALYLMGKKKSCDISVRAIAKEAGVNVSAINYYFRSKEEMLRLVKEFYIENTLAVLSILRREESAEDKLLLAANEIMEYSLRFPGNKVIRLHSRYIVDHDEVSSRVIALTDELGVRLKHVFRQVVKSTEPSLQYKYFMFISSINYPTDYEEIVEFDGSILVEPEHRMDYLRLLLRTLQT